MKKLFINLLLILILIITPSGALAAQNKTTKATTPTAKTQASSNVKTGTSDSPNPDQYRTDPTKPYQYPGYPYQDPTQQYPSTQNPTNPSQQYPSSQYPYGPNYSQDPTNPNQYQDPTANTDPNNQTGQPTNPTNQQPTPVASPTTFQLTQVSPTVSTKVKAGDTVNYQISYVNSGQSPANVTVIYPVNDALDLNESPSSMTVTLNGKSLTGREYTFINGDKPESIKTNYPFSKCATWTIDNVAAGQGGTITFSATVNKEITTVGNLNGQLFYRIGDNGNLQKTTEVTNPQTGTNSDSDSDNDSSNNNNNNSNNNNNNSNSSVRPIVTINLLQQAKRQDGTTYGEKTNGTVQIDYVAGNQVTYYITVANLASTSAKNVTVTDPIPDGLDVVTDSISDSGTVTGVTGKQTVKWEIPELGPNSTKELTVQFTCNLPLNSSQHLSFKNTAYVTYEGATNTVASNQVTLSDALAATPINTATNTTPSSSTTSSNNGASSTTTTPSTSSTTTRPSTTSSGTTSTTTPRTTTTTTSTPTNSTTANRTTTTSNTSTNPQTGLESVYTPALVLVLIGACALVAYNVYKKRLSSQNNK